MFWYQAKAKIIHWYCGYRYLFSVKNNFICLQKRSSSFFSPEDPQNALPDRFGRFNTWVSIGATQKSIRPCLYGAEFQRATRRNALMRVYLEQFDTSMVAPSQLRPPQRGVGLSQDLERHRQELTPSTPSLLLQGCQGAQGPKPPLMVWFRSWQRVNSGRFIQELLDSLSWQSV